MGRFHRKTAPGVRDGQVQRKNNWKRSPSFYHDPQPRLVIDRRQPGEGYRHLLLKRDIERFIALIPKWDVLSVGLDLISLDRGRGDCAGWYDRGAIGICARPINMRFEPDWDWYCEHRDFFERIELRVEGTTPDDIVIHWTPWTARAYQLCHVFLHELGHHIDRMHTRTKKDNGPRGEPFAENYAFDLEKEVLERYFHEFGLPE
jgi:hypothetical protein